MPGHGIGDLVQKDRTYSGQIDDSGAVSGYGVLRFLVLPKAGDEEIGFFLLGKPSTTSTGRSFALTGPAVQTFANPKASDRNWKKFEGIFQDGVFGGFGVLTFGDDSLFWGKWAPGGNMTEPATYQRASDKAVFETERSGGFMTGHGVMWSSEGQPLCLCEWKIGRASCRERV